ncbi:hypothetical protein SNEBB_003645 [Seison nebaliae]|nr:hypothetical protein SNEBB_003645 [Seison nebaliae]
MKFLLILLVTLSIVLCKTTHDEDKHCSSSGECPKGECCVNPGGDGLVDLHFQNFHDLFMGSQLKIGRCRKRIAKKGEVCEGCDCEEGTTCYRPMSGVCCPSRKCYDKDYVIKQKEYWNNCKPPTCYFPA